MYPVLYILYLHDRDKMGVSDLNKDGQQTGRTNPQATCAVYGQSRRNQQLMEADHMTS